MVFFALSFGLKLIKAQYLEVPSFEFPHLQTLVGLGPLECYNDDLRDFYINSQ